MGVFHVFKIVQILPNRATHDIFLIQSKLCLHSPLNNSLGLSIGLVFIYYYLFIIIYLFSVSIYINIIEKPNEFFNERMKENLVRSSKSFHYYHYCMERSRRNKHVTLRKKCLYSEFFSSVFSCIRTEYGAEKRRI